MFCWSLVLGIATPYTCRGISEDNRSNVHFFRYDVVTIKQELIMELFDLGEVRAGEQIQIQLYVRNASRSKLTFSQAKEFPADIRLDPGSTTIESSDTALLRATLDVPMNPKDLNTSFRMEARLSETCRLMGMFKAKIVDVAAFATEQMTFEFTENDSSLARLEVPIPLLLSDAIELNRLLANCDEQSSFVSLSWKKREGNAH